MMIDEEYLNLSIFEELLDERNVYVAEDWLCQEGGFERDPYGNMFTAVTERGVLKRGQQHPEAFCYMSGGSEPPKSLKEIPQLIKDNLVESYKGALIAYLDKSILDRKEEHVLYWRNEPCIEGKAKKNFYELRVYSRLSLA